MQEGSAQLTDKQFLHVMGLVRGYIMIKIDDRDLGSNELLPPSLDGVRTVEAACPVGVATP